MAIRIVQLTDLHLYRDPASRLAGVDTWATFRAVLAQVKSRRVDPDYLVLTGDLAQDEELDTYLMLREELGEWVERCRIIPGNHDDRSNLRQVFPELFTDSGEALTFRLAAGGWRIIGLDSQIPGEVNGRVDDAQLAWLRTEMGNAPGVPTLLFVHHPPLPISVDWIDKLGLIDSSGLVELIESSPEVKVVCAGHVHQEFSGRIGAAEMYTTPSTCVQFGARTEKTFDTRMAGYRLLTLDGDAHHSAVYRLAEERGEPAAPDP